MRRRRLSKKFFIRHTLKVAQSLLGKYLVRRHGKREIARKITDVEAYVGFHDRASHASRGRTARNAVMFGQAGVWYVYFVYGRHWMLNVVTESKGFPAAVLIRGVCGISGPARVTKFFKIGKKFNGRPAAETAELWIEDRGVKISRRHIRRGRRVGVGYSGPWEAKPWRFFVQ